MRVTGPGKLEQSPLRSSLIARDGQVIRVSMRRQNGFSLIELLVVIAIIGILAAIIFPVYAQAKKSAYKSSDLSNMNSLRTALQLYKADNGQYPPALLGYVGPYQNGSTTNGENVTNGNIVPANAVRDALYPKRVESLSVFRPALNRISDSQQPAPGGYTVAPGLSDPLVTNAYWPNNVNLAAKTGNPNDQRYGSKDIVRRAYTNLDGNCSVVPNVYYRISGYDVAPYNPTLSGSVMESHYQLFWSANAVPQGLDVNASDCTGVSGGGGSGTDTPRQLGYSDPPETTVVTWNPFFRDYSNGAPIHQKQDLVLFLGGNARPYDSANMANQAWTAIP